MQKLEDSHADQAYYFIRWIIPFISFYVDMYICRQAFPELYCDSALRN